MSSGCHLSDDLTAFYVAVLGRHCDILEDCKTHIYQGRELLMLPCQAGVMMKSENGDSSPILPAIFVMETLSEEEEVLQHKISEINNLKP